MQVSRTTTARALRDRRGERGGTRLKFLIIIIVLAALAYSGYQYLPVAYQAYQFKDYMQQNVDKAAALGQPADWVVSQLKASATQYDVPPNAEINAEMRNGRIEARVRFARLVALPFYTYQYDFDHTVKSSELFAPKPNP